MSRPLRFANKVALVTGGASGIGAATVAAFLREGARVAVLDVDGEQGARVAAEHVGGTLFVPGDVRDPEDCGQVVRSAVREFGRLDVVFCNAGVFEPGTAETQTVESWRWQVDVLLTGTFLTCKSAIPALRASGGGSIVLSGSNCAHIGCAGRFAYTAAKAAMPVLAKQLSNDYFHSARIRVNCVSPGYVRTPMTERIWRSQTGAATDTPLPEGLAKSWQEPEAVADVVLFLASDEARDVTGVTVPVSRTGLLRVAAQRMA